MFYLIMVMGVGTKSASLTSGESGSDVTSELLDQKDRKYEASLMSHSTSRAHARQLDLPLGRLPPSIYRARFHSACDRQVDRQGHIDRSGRDLKACCSILID